MRGPHSRSICSALKRNEGMPQLTERQSPDGRAVQRRGDAKNLAPPFAERNRKAALLAELDIRQRPRLHIVGFFRTLGLHISHIGVELFLW